MPSIETGPDAGTVARTDSELRISEIRFRRLFETARDGILLVNAKSGRIEEVNPFLIELLGYSRDEFLGKCIWDIGFLASVAANKEKFLELQKQEYIRYEDLPLETAAGATIHVEFVSNVYREGGDEIIQCNIRDISARKRADEKYDDLLSMFRTIIRCNESLVRASDEIELCTQMCSKLIQHGGFKMAVVGYLGGGEDVRMLPRAWAGVGDATLDELRATWADPDGPGTVGTAMRTGEPSVCRDVAHDVSAWADRATASKAGIAAIGAFPLMTGANAHGVLAVYSSDGTNFGEEATGLLRNLAGDIAFGIATIRSRVASLKISDKLERSFDHAVAAIAATVEQRDPYTAGHQRRVAHLATAIATEMGMSASRIEGLHMAAVIHDIGKIHVPIEILTSPAKLTDAEIAIIRTHSRAGWDILKGIDFPWPIADIVLQHHERLDGSGYPQGLKGDQILLEARVLTVADVVEAMASRRPYRQAIGVFAAMQEISRQKGKFYDPAVVEACLKVFLSNGYEFETPEA
jgi:PAS domain S-box-containing protein/putative nucleotidyltransferase with HDIG domain